jgi:transposase
MRYPNPQLTIGRFLICDTLRDVHEQLKRYYSEIGRPSIDPELMIRMLIMGYSIGPRRP